LEAFVIGARRRRMRAGTRNESGAGFNAAKKMRSRYQAVRAAAAPTTTTSLEQTVKMMGTGVVSTIYAWTPCLCEREEKDEEAADAAHRPSHRRSCTDRRLVPPLWFATKQIACE
jgi:hypothetical protein